MEAVLTQIPSHRKWANDFIAYVQSLKVDVCEVVEDNGESFGDLHQVIENKLLM